ncbi:MAG: serine hydrolase domain-containing protein [Bryobacteraceae bacterium]
MRRRVAILLACGALALAAADRTGMDPARLARIPERMKGYVDQGTAAGFVTLVARNGRVASLEAVGYQDREKKIPMRTDTIFRIASLTKPITCAAAMILIDEGRISLLDPVEKHLPEFRGQKLNPCGQGGSGFHCAARDPSRPIQIRDVMTHTSGLPARPSSSETKLESLAAVVAEGAKQQLMFEPGTKWSYSNLGIDVVARIVEVVSGQPFAAFAAERIFRPLAMEDTHFWLPAEKAGRLAAMYELDGEMLKRIERPLFGNSKVPATAGGLLSTASDLARFYQMMLNKGTLDGKRILSAAAVELMTAVHTGDIPAGWSPGVGFGLGWAVVKDPAGTFRYNSIGSYGHGGAFRTYGWVDPAKNLAGVILFHRTNGGGDMADEISSFMALAAAAIEE